MLEVLALFWLIRIADDVLIFFFILAALLSLIGLEITDSIAVFVSLLGNEEVVVFLFALYCKKSQYFIVVLCFKLILALLLLFTGSLQSGHSILFLSHSIRHNGWNIWRHGNIFNISSSPKYSKHTLHSFTWYENYFPIFHLKKI